MDATSAMLLTNTLIVLSMDEADRQIPIVYVVEYAAIIGIIYLIILFIEWIRERK